MYVVPNVPLIPQTLNMACWYASAQMLIQWRREATQSSEQGIIDPSEDPPSVTLQRANNGLQDSQILPLARALGLEAVPPVCTTLDVIQKWLQVYGPLWTNGATHITVIVGINTETNKLFIHNPAPVNTGRKEWKDASWLEGSEVSSLDPNTNAAVFLHCPPRS